MNINIHRHLVSKDASSKMELAVALQRRYTITIPHCITAHNRGVIMYIAKKAFWLSSGILYEDSCLRKLFSYKILCPTIFR